MAKSLLRSFIQFRKDEAGQGLIEYALILALIALAAVAGMGNVATSIASGFSKVGSLVGLYIS